MRPAFLFAVLAALAWARGVSALTLAVQESACRSVTAHLPSPDVEYRPGVDVHGKAVIPADLNGGIGLDLFNEIVVDITTDFAGRLASAAPLSGSASSPGSASKPARPPKSAGQAPQPSFFTNGFVGTVVLEGGRLLFNGRPLQDPFEEELALLCATAQRGR